MVVRWFQAMPCCWTEYCEFEAPDAEDLRLNTFCIIVNPALTSTSEQTRVCKEGFGLPWSTNQKLIIPLSYKQTYGRLLVGVLWSFQCNKVSQWVVQQAFQVNFLAAKIWHLYINLLCIISYEMTEKKRVHFTMDHVHSICLHFHL